MATSQPSPTQTDELFDLAEREPSIEIADRFISLAADAALPIEQRDALFNAARTGIALFEETVLRPPTDPAEAPLSPNDLERVLRTAESRFLAAYRLDPTDLESARNVERTRLLLDQLRQAREEAQAQQQQREDLADQLESLAEEQQRLADESRTAPSDAAPELAERQADLRERTAEALEELLELSQSDPSLSESSRRMQDAMRSQGEAQEDLADGLPFPAAESQDLAAQALRDAAEAVRPQEQDGERSPGEPQEPGESDEQQEPEDTSESGEPSEGEPELSELDQEERQNRADREALRRRLTVPQRTVERDW